MDPANTIIIDLTFRLRRCASTIMREGFHGNRTTDFRASRKGSRKHSAHSDPAGWELVGRLFRALGQQQNLPVAMRGPGLFDNYCSCPDFAVNTLGTCKHIEALLVRLRRRRGEALDREVFNRARASLSLHYGDTLNVRLRLPLSPSPALQALARAYFDHRGLLKSPRLRDFGKLMDELRKADDFCNAVRRIRLIGPAATSYVFSATY